MPATQHDASGSKVSKKGDTITGRLTLTYADDVDLSGVSGTIIIGNDGTGQHIAIDNNEIMSKSNATTAAALNININGGAINVGSGGVNTTGAISTNTISEKTAATGVTIDGCLIKDGNVEGKIKNIFNGKTVTAVDWGDAQITYAYLDDGGVFTDYTSQANWTDVNDVPLMPTTEVVNDAFYFGMYKTFTYIKINIGIAGVGSAITWEYYNGSAWTTLTCTDNTTGFTVAGTNSVTFTAPGSWALTTVNGISAYWIRARVSTASYTVQPIATQIWLDGTPTDLQNATDGNISTSTTKGSMTTPSAYDFGKIIVDLGAIKTVLVGARIGIWNNAANNITYIDSSDDDITYRPREQVMEWQADSSEAIRDLKSSIVTGRYIRLTFTVDGAVVANAKVYEFTGIDIALL